MKYECQSCGNISLKWEGKCSVCGEWGTLEQVEDQGSKGKRSGSKGVTAPNVSRFQLEDKENSDGKISNGQNSGRLSSGLSEFDRVLGGGFVPGEVVLLTGQPGVGKSTLLLQMISLLASQKNVLYFSGEESVSQLEGRFRRIMSADPPGQESASAKKSREFQYSSTFDVVSGNGLESLISLLNEKKYDLVVVDSIQSLVSSDSDSYPGSITQVRNCGYKLVDHAKRNGVIMVIVGQINKSGNVAGPKVLEHIVDGVMHMEGDKDDYYKILRAQKNRFGSTDEIGVFEMGPHGLEDVPNPSQVFLSDEENVSGSVIGAVVEGSRVVFIEVQALVADHGSSPGPLMRVANGIKRQRVEMLCAVLSRRGDVFLGDKDIFINVSGGVEVNSPSLDLAVCAAIKSSFQDKEISKDVIYVGEVGLTGGVKKFVGIERVLSESSRLGYKEFVGPIDSSRRKIRVKKLTQVSKL